MNRRVLLIDDAQDIRTIAQISLERVGQWTVVPAEDGQAGLRAAREDDPFDAVLLDVMMPSMDGPTTLERLRADGLSAQVPVIFLTAKAQATELERLLSLGAAGVITKPFDPLTLPDELEQLIESAQAARS
jgi:two-component system, OmpR family, response regulator